MAKNTNDSWQCPKCQGTAKRIDYVKVEKSKRVNGAWYDEIARCKKCEPYVADVKPQPTSMGGIIRRSARNSAIWAGLLFVLLLILNALIFGGRTFDLSASKFLLFGLPLASFVFFTVFGARKRIEKIETEAIEKSRKAAGARERKRLADLKKQMTPAEWAMYEVQLENKKLLKDIKKKAEEPTSQWVRGVTYELGDD